MKAFPNSAEYPLRNDGMDLRDYFAAKAMQALIDSTTYKSPSLGLGEPTYHVADNGRIANISYQIADAMMKAREQ